MLFEVRTASNSISSVEDVKHVHRKSFYLLFLACPKDFSRSLKSASPLGATRLRGCILKAEGATNWRNGSRASCQDSAQNPTLPSSGEDAKFWCYSCQAPKHQYLLGFSHIGSPGPAREVNIGYLWLHHVSKISIRGEK